MVRGHDADAEFLLKIRVVKSVRRREDPLAKVAVLITQSEGMTATVSHNGRYDRRRKISDRGSHDVESTCRCGGLDTHRIRLAGARREVTRRQRAKDARRERATDPGGLANET